MNDRITLLGNYYFEYFKDIRNLGDVLQHYL